MCINGSIVGRRHRHNRTHTRNSQGTSFKVHVLIRTPSNRPTGDIKQTLFETFVIWLWLVGVWQRSGCGGGGGKKKLCYVLPQKEH